MSEKDKSKEQLLAEVTGLRQKVRALEHRIYIQEHTEHAIRESEDRYLRLVEGAPDAIAVHSRGKFVYMNASGAKLLGARHPAELIGRPITDIISPEYVEIVKERVRRNQEDGEPTPLMEQKLVRLDGRGIDVEVAGIPVMYFGKPATQIIIRDISDRKRVEDALKAAVRRIADEKDKTEAVIESMGDAISVQDRDYRILYQNRRHKEMIGEHVGEYCYRAYQHKDSVCEGCHLSLAFQDGAIHGREQSRKTAEGVRHYEITASPIKDVSGNVVAGIEAVRDITDRKQAEEMTKKALAEKELLLKEIHHRLKNNLGIISSLLRLQLASITDPKIADVLQDSLDRISTMALIHKKLYQTEDFTRVNFKEYVSSLINALALSYTGSRANIMLTSRIQDISLDVDTAVPCALIITELVTNSLKYAFPADRTGEVVISLETESGEYVLSVSDNGIGLPHDFDLTQAKSLGLRLVGMLAKQLGGAVQVSSGKGTMFIISFEQRQEQGRDD